MVREVVGNLRKSNHCIPEEDACNSVKYLASIQEYNISDYKESNMSLVTIAYQDHDVEHLITHINYGTPELICEIGGVLGLTLGASALSLLGVLENLCQQILLSIVNHPYRVR